MPKPLPSVVSENKICLVSIFCPYLLCSKYGYSVSSTITISLIKDIIIHKSFGASFTYEIRNSKMKYTHITKAINNLADSIYAYLTNKPFIKQGDFDKWHKGVGETFLEDCSSYKKFEFGKAQKIINVTMKHLFCYNISEDYFKFCHIALDSMTYTGRPSNSLDGGFYKHEVSPTATTISFSNLSYEDYITIQNNIRKYLLGVSHCYKDSKTGSSLTPFKAEFYIWPRYKR